MPAWAEVGLMPLWLTLDFFGWGDVFGFCCGLLWRFLRAGMVLGVLSRFPCLCVFALFPQALLRPGRSCHWRLRCCPWRLRCCRWRLRYFRWRPLLPLLATPLLPLVTPLLLLVTSLLSLALLPLLLAAPPSSCRSPSSFGGLRLSAEAARPLSHQFIALRLLDGR